MKIFNTKTLLFFLVSKKLTKILIVVFLLVLPVVLIEGRGVDTPTFLEWLELTKSKGYVNTYAEVGKSDTYPPLIFLLFSLVCKIGSFWQITTFSLLKITLLFFLYVNWFIFWSCTKNFWSSISLHFCMSIITMYWCYVDIFFLPFMIISLWLLYKNKYLWFAITFTTTCLIKWQPLIITPFLFLYILDICKKNSSKNFDYLFFLKNFVFPAILIITITYCLFDSTIFHAFMNSFAHSISQDGQLLSGFALNFSWIWTYSAHYFFPEKWGSISHNQFENLIMTNDLFLLSVPRILFCIMFISILFKFNQFHQKSFTVLIAYSLLGYYTYFIFYTGVCENHLIPAIVLVYLWNHHQQKYQIESLLISLIVLINLLIFFGSQTYRDLALYDIHISVYFSIFNLLLYIFYFRKITSKFNFLK